MSDRARFETEEIRGLAERYGGRRVVVEPATKHHPAVMAYSFPSLCWCCPNWRRVELVRRPDADPDERSWQAIMCPYGCRSVDEDAALTQPCPTGKAGHAGYRDVPEARDDEPHTAYVYDHRDNRSLKIARCSCGWESTPSVGWRGAKAALDAHVATDPAALTTEE